MGAEFNSTTLQATTKAEAVKEFFTVIRPRALYEYGHRGYTGSFAETPGLTMTDHKFSSDRDAEDWLSSNAVKWRDALGVWVQGKDDPQPHILIGAWCSP